jgi:branched-chain amino acid transport system substrate-binding protein
VTPAGKAFAAMIPVLAAVALSGAIAGAAAAEELRIGLVTTLSGPGATAGIDIRDGFLLGVDTAGGRLGGLETRVIEADDQQKPETAVALANRMVERDRVHMVAGVVWSNVALAMMPTLAAARTFLISANAGPSQLAGHQCNLYFFNVSWAVDAMGEAAGEAARKDGHKRVHTIAPNYPAGRDIVAGFKRRFAAPLAGETYTALGQLDYAAEIARLRAEAPDALFVFLPGGMGINFLKQYEQAGLRTVVPMIGPGFSFDQDTLPAVGHAALGVRNVLQWSQDFDIPANREFVAAFAARFGRQPSYYAAQAYDAARLIDGAVRMRNGDLADKDGLRAALASAPFESVRGPFRFNVNRFPIQTYHLREVVRLSDGSVGNRTLGTVLADHADAHAADCRMR